MNFIKSIWNKVKSFFGNLLTSNKAKAVEVKVAPVIVAEAANNAEQAEQEVQAQQIDQTAAEAHAKQCEAIMITICEIAKFRNYKTDEAVAAYKAGNLEALQRIELAMSNKAYKAPSKSQLKALRKAA